MLINLILCNTAHQHVVLCGLSVSHFVALCKLLTTDECMKKHVTPTLLHLVALHGLQNLSMKLMDLPDSAIAYSIINKQHKQPVDMAREAGHSDLAAYLQNQQEVVRSLCICKLNCLEVPSCEGVIHQSEFVVENLDSLLPRMSMLMASMRWWWALFTTNVSNRDARITSLSQKYMLVMCFWFHVL